jgi:hypothetical protein
MFNRNSALRGRGPDFFFSAKTSTAIRARHPALREGWVSPPFYRSEGYVLEMFQIKYQIRPGCFLYGPAARPGLSFGLVLGTGPQRVERISWPSDERHQGGNRQI